MVIHMALAAIAILVFYFMAIHYSFCENFC